MLNLYNIRFEGQSQGFCVKEYATSPSGDSAVIMTESTRTYRDFCCPECGDKVYVHEPFQVRIKDMPNQPNVPLYIHYSGHRYRCSKCGETFTEEIPFKYPGTRITRRAAEWIRTFLNNKISIRAIQKMTGIHWETIRRIQMEMMEEAIAAREEEKKASDYQLKYLAVDEFALHKGHSYATCVMDLETGEVIWVGIGRSKKDFEVFFEQIPQSSLSTVIAVAMDMNASYHCLIEKYLPQAQIVYDRYHMQAQFGKEVLGTVRLEEARKHKANAKELLADISEHTDKDSVKNIKTTAASEKKLYSELKRSRWTLLRKKESLSQKQDIALRSILSDHENLAVCYAMKEEMCDLFALTDYDTALDGWIRWFDAAKQSSVFPLVHFAVLKEKRLLGLASHALFPISTGKLEGFNNKIKVAKRIAYGYRDSRFFFTLIRFLSLPLIRA